MDGFEAPKPAEPMAVAPPPPVSKPAKPAPAAAAAPRAAAAAPRAALAAPRPAAVKAAEPVWEKEEGEASPPPADEPGEILGPALGSGSALEEGEEAPPVVGALRRGGSAAAAAQRAPARGATGGYERPRAPVGVRGVSAPPQRAPQTSNVLRLANMVGLTNFLASQKYCSLEKKGIRGLLLQSVFLP